MAALLLFATLTMPAVAEIGCTSESIAHLQDSRASTTDQHLTVSEGEQQGDEEQGDASGHCSFSHGHCAGIGSASSRAEQPWRGVGTFAVIDAQPLVPTVGASGERPPSA